MWGCSRGVQAGHKAKENSRVAREPQNRKGLSSETYKSRAGGKVGSLALHAAEEEAPGRQELQETVPQTPKLPS